jgi:hypothetical protein
MLRKLTPPPKPHASQALIFVGRGKYTIVDPDDYYRLSAYRWRIKMSARVPYVVRKVRTKHGQYLVRLHRSVTHCPPDRVVHHINGNTLDNRASNLKVCTKYEHRHLHNRP